MTITPTPEFRMVYANDKEVRDYTFSAPTLAESTNRIERNPYGFNSNPWSAKNNETFVILAASIVFTITSCSTTTKNAAHYKKPYNKRVCAAYH